MPDPTEPKRPHAVKKKSKRRLRRGSRKKRRTPNVCDSPLSFAPYLLRIQKNDFDIELEAAVLAVANDLLGDRLSGRNLLELVDALDRIPPILRVVVLAEVAAFPESEPSPDNDVSQTQLDALLSMRPPGMEPEAQPVVVSTPDSTITTVEGRETSISQLLAEAWGSWGQDALTLCSAHSNYASSRILRFATSLGFSSQWLETMLSRQPLSSLFASTSVSNLRLELTFFYLQRTLEYKVADRLCQVSASDLSDHFRNNQTWTQPTPRETIDQASIKRNFAQIIKNLDKIGRLIVRSDGVDCAILRPPTIGDSHEHSMQTTYFQHHIGEALDLAESNPITIFRHNKPIAVLEALDVT